MTTLFISDLHLDESRPGVTALFLRFLAEEARGADALYILGDLFEAWVGDDDPTPLGAEVAAGLCSVRESGTPVYFMRGNRDFLVGPDYARRAGMEILNDPAVVLLDGRPTLLMHGDLLCTADAGYMAFRAQTRHPDWQAKFLAQPLAARLAFAQQAREQSRLHQSALKDAGMMETITDVTPVTVDQHFVHYGIDLMIHGHTHRPAVHRLDAAGRPCRRVVLGDWYEQGSVLRANRNELVLEAIA